MRFKDLKIKLRSQYPYVTHVMFPYEDDDVLSEEEVRDIYEYFENLNRR